MYEYAQQAKEAWAKNGGWVVAIILVIVIIVLVIALWFIYDASCDIANLYWWLPAILILLLLLDVRLFFFAALLLIIFSLWLNYAHHERKQDRQLKYGCDYEQKLRECRKKPCDQKSRSKSRSKSDKYHSD